MTTEIQADTKNKKRLVSVKVNSKTGNLLENVR